jgi:hypothetical protein
MTFRRALAAGLTVRQHRSAAVEDAVAEWLIEVAPVAGDLVEDQRQCERDVLVVEAGVARPDRDVAQVRGGPLDDGTVSTVLLERHR